jgi:GTP-binding protein Era
MILFDTPGIIETKRNKLEERMMSAVISSIQNSEAIVAVVDSDNEPREALAMFQPGDNWTGPPMAVLLNKADLLNAEELEELVEW